MLIYGLTRELITEGGNVEIRDSYGSARANISSGLEGVGKFAYTGLAVYSSDGKYYSLELENATMSLTFEISKKYSYTGGMVLEANNARGYYLDDGGVAVNVAADVRNADEFTYYLYYNYLLKNIVQFSTVVFLEPLTVVNGDDGKQYKTVICEAAGNVYYYFAVEAVDLEEFRKNVVVEYIKIPSRLENDIVSACFVPNLGNGGPLMTYSLQGVRVNPRSVCFRTFIYEDNNTLMSTLSKLYVPTVVSSGSVGGLRDLNMYMFSGPYSKNKKVLLMYQEAEYISSTSVFEGVFNVLTRNVPPERYTNNEFNFSVAVDLERDVFVIYYYTNINPNILCKDGWKFWAEMGIANGGVSYVYKDNQVRVRAKVERNGSDLSGMGFILFRFRLPVPDLIQEVNGLENKQNTEYYVTTLPALPRYIEVERSVTIGGDRYWGSEDIIYWNNANDLEPLGLSGTMYSKVLRLRDDGKVDVYIRTFTAGNSSSVFDVRVRAWF